MMKITWAVGSGSSAWMYGISAVEMSNTQKLQKMIQHQYQLLQEKEKVGTWAGLCSLEEPGELDELTNLSCQPITC